MDPSNPYEPPQSELVHPDQERGPVDVPLVPWEDPALYPGFPARVVETMKLVFRPAEAGPSFGLHPKVGPAITYFACIGLPLVWVMQILVALVGSPDSSAPILDLFGLPHQTPPPEMAQFQKTIQVAVALFFPISMALGMAVIGFASHGGLWLVRGLGAGRGLAATFRTLLYAYGTYNAVLWIFNGWVLVPPVAGLVLLGISGLLSLAFFVHAGVLLARAHGTETWRGVLGMFLPWIVFACCCGGAAAALGGLAATLARGR
ncbi:MAG: hypothetical protein IPL96_16150 [Holophagaceae bacterium]|nr:hypothetical protein [Holophagaceae bacterium]